METYRVEHRTRAIAFYVLANSPQHAVEQVTMHIGDAEGRKAWGAEPDTTYSPGRGAILDKDGKPCKIID